VILGARVARIGGAARGIRGGDCVPSPSRPEVKEGGGSHSRGPRVSGRGAGAGRAAGATAASELGGRGWAAAGPGVGSPLFFFNRNRFLLFSFLASKQKQNKHQQINKIKQKLCSSMNAYKHVSTLYLILFNFVNYLINAKEIQTKPKIKLNSN